jgi:hypothetical protein
MTKHYPRPSHHKQKEQQQQEQPRERGWYCKEHNTKYLCDICGYDNSKQKEMKYYFING